MIREFNSKIDVLGSIKLPEFSGIRVLMMPFKIEDIQTTIPFESWKFTLQEIMKVSPCKAGTAYLTIDELSLKAGDTHRRPGLHVDGWKDESGNDGSWGGGGWGSSVDGEGMLLITNVLGSVGYQQKFLGTPNKFGDCEHLRVQIDRSYLISNQPTKKINFEPSVIYRLDGLTVHESIPVKEDCNRQFVRISMPSKANWNSSNTPSPFGLLPDGPIVESRPDQFTNYGSKFNR